MGHITRNNKPEAACSCQMQIIKTRMMRLSWHSGYRSKYLDNKVDPTQLELEARLTSFDFKMSEESKLANKHLTETNNYAYTGNTKSKPSGN